MVFCIIALVVFGVMGIFSASHRALAKEAAECVFRMATLRKCESKFDEKWKMKISVGLMKSNPILAKQVYKHFSLISWALVLITVISSGYSIYALYNLAVYGTCDPSNPETCVIATGIPLEKIKIECEKKCSFSLSECTDRDFISCGINCECLSQVCGTEKDST